MLQWFAQVLLLPLQSLNWSLQSLCSIISGTYWYEVNVCWMEWNGFENQEVEDMEKNEE